MTDLYVDFIATDDAFNFGLQIESGDLKTDAGLKSAVIYSLFTDRKASNDDVIPDGTDNLRGHWGDSVLDDVQDSEGSKLWLLSREKQTAQTLSRAIEYAEEALQWLVDDDVAENISVIGEWLRTGIIALGITIDLPNGEIYTVLQAVDAQETTPVVGNALSDSLGSMIIDVNGSIITTTD